MGRLNEAIKDFDIAISREPTDSRAFGYRGKAHFLNNDNDRALPDLNRAIALDGSNATALVTRGRSFSQIGRVRESAGRFRRSA